MPIDRYPFTAFTPGGIARPLLPIRITNPATGKFITTYGLIDTGADDCAIPATYAPLLDHNLTAVASKAIGTGNGNADVYPHTTRIEIFSMIGAHSIVHTINDTPIDFMPAPVVLLGVNTFLSGFKLIIDYPNQCFSIKHP